MWIISELRKDALIMGGFLIGVILLMYLTMGRFDWSFFRYTMHIFIAIMSIITTMLMKNTVGKSTKNMFKFLAITYSYLAISVIIMLIIKSNYGLYTDKLYINFRLGIDIFEIVAILMAYTYLDKEFNQTQRNFIRLLFFWMMIYTFIMPKAFDASISHLKVLTCVIESIIMGLVLWIGYLNYSLIGKFDRRIIYRMYLFLGFKCSYHLATIFYINNLLHVGYFMLVFLRFMYTYYLVSAIFYERVMIPWHELVCKIKVTEEKLNDNENDRNSIINLSHELKTPINVIQSAADVLKLNVIRENDEELVKAIQSIKKTCYRATKLITHIIDNNKLAEGYLQPKYIACNFVMILENTIMSLVRYNPNWQILFDPKDEEINVYIDEELIQRSILNLIALLMGYQKIEPTLYIDLEVIDHQVELCIRSPYTTLPQNYIDKEETCYNSENINEMASFEFVKEVLKLHEAKIHFINTQQGELDVYIQLEHKPFLNHNEIQMIDYEENIDRLLGRIKMQYGDL